MKDINIFYNKYDHYGIIYDLQVFNKSILSDFFPKKTQTKPYRPNLPKSHFLLRFYVNFCVDDLHFKALNLASSLFAYYYHHHYFEQIYYLYCYYFVILKTLNFVVVHFFTMKFINYS